MGAGSKLWISELSGGRWSTGTVKHNIPFHSPNMALIANIAGVVWWALEASGRSRRRGYGSC